MEEVATNVYRTRLDRRVASYLTGAVDKIHHDMARGGVAFEHSHKYEIQDSISGERRNMFAHVVLEGQLWKF